MLSAQQLKAGLEYAQDNFENDSAPHLHVDKRVIKDLLDLNGKQVLDFGCGMGGMTLWYGKTWDCEVLGLDIDENHITVSNIMKTRLQIKNVNFEHRNIVEQPLSPEKKFDQIFMNDVVEHIKLPLLKKVFQNLRNILAPDGRIFVSYPPWKSPHASHVSHAVKIPWCQYLPEQTLRRMIAANEHPLVGTNEPNLMAAYDSLNKLEHHIFHPILEKCGWKIDHRKSYSSINKIPGLWNVNLRIFPFNYLITKEFLMLSAK